MSDREQLTESLRAGRWREAARVAGRLARAGHWDHAVAATLHLHARPEAPERERARAWLAVALAAARLEEEPGSPAALSWTIDELLAAGRVDEALDGLRLATRAGLAEATTWLRAAFALASSGRAADARRVVEEALTFMPSSASLWGVAAQLRFAAGEAAAARDAVGHATRLDPHSPIPHLTAAVLCASAGDRRGSAEHLDAARSLGAPAEVVCRYARAAAAR